MKFKWGIAIVMAGLGTAQASQECAEISDRNSRLACYDAEYRPSINRNTVSQWDTQTERSAIDDSVSVFVSVDSQEPIQGRFSRGKAPARLVMRCVENTTSLLFNFNDNHMTSHQQYGEVTLRIDDGRAFTRRMNESTNNRTLGLWSGGQSIPVIRDMFGADLLTVRATPFSESPITVQFPISGIEDAVAPLREACNW